MAERKPLLDLTTLAPERQFITIDGERYDLVLPSELGLKDALWLDRMSERGRQLAAKGADGFTDEEFKELDRLLDQAVQMIVLGLPDEVRARLTVIHKVRLLEVFTQALSGSQPAGQNRAQRRAVERQRKRTGASSSRASNGSTGATPSAGS